MLYKIIWFGFSEGFLMVRKETTDMKKERTCSKLILPLVVCITCTRRALWVPHHTAAFLFSASVRCILEGKPHAQWWAWSGGGLWSTFLRAWYPYKLFRILLFQLFMSAYTHADINSYLSSTLILIQSYMSYLVVQMIPVLILWKAFHLASVTHAYATILVSF